MTKAEEHGGVATFDRRRFLTGSVTTSTIMFVSGTALIHPGEAWGLEVHGLKVETVTTLIKVARDIYPHDRLPDKYYAVAIKSYDEKAAKDSTTKALIEDGIALIDNHAKSRQGTLYTDIKVEASRVAILQEIESEPFFQTLRSGLIVGLYNQKEIWPLFGYEGESASQGGYIQRGFNDLTWL